MRRAPLALRIALIASLVVMAGNSAYAQNNNNGPQKFGSINCRDKIPCSSGSVYVSATQLADNANACISQGLGMSLEGGFFDQTAGLDLSGCLTVRSELLAKKDAKTVLPKCCQITSNDNSCSFHCDLVNGW